MQAHEFMHEMAVTSAVFGRQHGINVVFKGDQAGTDGKTIMLPALPLDKKLSPAQVRAMRGYVDHEAGHIRHSDMPRVMEFYDRCLHNGKEDLKNLHNALEDIWMEERVMDDYAGSRKNITQVTELVKGKEYDALEETRKKLGGKDPLEKMSVQAAGLGITTVGRKSYGGENLEKLMDVLPDNLKDHADKWCEEALKCKNSGEVITLAKSVYKLLKEDDPDLQSNPEDFDPQAGEGMDEGENSPEYQRGQMDGENPFASKSLEAKEEEGEGEGEPAWAKGEQMDDALNEPGDGASGCVGGEGPGLSGGYKVYTTEKDVQYRRGKNPPPFADRDTQRVIDSTNHADYDNRKSSISGNIMTMKSKLKRALLAKQRRDWDTGREVGRLDSKRLVAAYAGHRSVFKQRTDREEEDTAVTILVDLSGSMYGDRAEVARDCVVALAECLEGSSIAYNVVGFCNKRYPNEVDRNKYHRPEPLDTLFFKDFDDNLRTCRASIELIPEAVGGNNSDYDFIVNAVNDLKKRPEERKVLFVLSDGHPANSGGGSRQQLIKFCKDATETANKQGVECVGIGICDNSVSKIYKDHVVVQNVNELSSSVFNKLTQLLTKKVKR